MEFFDFLYEIYDKIKHKNYSLDEKNNISIYKRTKILDIKSFPIISFYQKDFNYTFEF